MSRRTFRLAAILRIRRAQEQQAAGALARAGALLAEADSAVAAAHTAHVTHSLEQGEGRAFMASVAARAALNVAAQDAEVERQLARAGVDAARDEWLAARRVTRSLEHLETKHRHAVKQDMTEQEQKTLDDFRTTPVGAPAWEERDE